VTFCLLGIMATIALTGCKAGNKSTSKSQPGSYDGTEKVKPAPGTGNVQGKVMYNSKPAENIEIKLCESFSRFLSGCGGKIYTARTDKDGEFVVTNVPPKTYEALMARVFDTDRSVFGTSGIAGISATKYDVVADKTIFVDQIIHLFKSDLKTINPKAAANVTVPGLELKWEAYPDAAYYKFNVQAEEPSVPSPYVEERTDSTSFNVSKPLPKGTYRWRVSAFNKDDHKLADSADDLKFTVQ
jgi:hypothetical protein